MKKLFLFCFLFSLVNVKAQWTQVRLKDGGFTSSVVKSGKDLYLGSDCGLYRSSNNGSSWTSLKVPYGFYPVKLADLNGTLLCYAVNYNVSVSDEGLYYFDKGTLEWKLSRKTFNTNSLLKVNGNIAYANSGDTLLKSLDGKNWIVEKIFAAPSSYLSGLAFKNAYIYAFQSDKVWYYYKNKSVVYSPLIGIPQIEDPAANDQYFFAAYQKGCYRSTDGFNWTFNNMGGLDSEYNHVCCHDSDVFVTSPHGVYYSANNGKSWTAVFSFNKYESITHLEIIGQAIYVGTSSDLYVSLNNGKDWKIINNNIQARFTNNLCDFQNKLYVPNDGKVISSVDLGKTWSETTLSNSGLINYMNGCVLNKGLYYFGYNGIFYSQDGNSWSKRNKGIADTVIFNLQMVGQTMVAISNTNKLYTSTDDGLNWSYKSTVPGPGLYYFRDQVSGDTLFIGQTHHLSYSIDKGSTWINSSGNLPSTIKSIIINKDKVFAATQKGIYYSDNRGNSWKDMNKGLPDSTNCVRVFIINDLLFLSTFPGLYLFDNSQNAWVFAGDKIPGYVTSVLYKDGWIFASVEGDGIWKRKYSEFFPSSIKEISQGGIEVFPNPSHGLFTIKGLTMSINCKVLDIQGKMITQKLVNAGERLDLSNLKAGIYFLELEVEGKMNKEKIVIE